MLKWSKFNLVFRSKKHGLMLFNALTNSLMEISPEFEPELERLQADPSQFDFSECLTTYVEFLKNRVLVTESEEQDQLNVMKTRKLASRYDSSSLALTVLVTEDCNFGCPYCYEEHKRCVDMSLEVQEKLVEFIERFKPLRQLYVTWMGGEPLMRFDTIERLSERLKSMGIPYGAMIVTNGWLLTEEVTSRLDELNIKAIQVTIDGPPEIHDDRRFHIEQGSSFHVIQENIDRLMLEEKWSGRLIVHVNIDENNAELFSDIHEYWTERYKGLNAGVTPSIVDRTEQGSRDMGCSFCKEREIQFYIDHYRKHGGKGLRYYPKPHRVGCIATKKNGYVVGAEGQLYKCWEDVGIKDKEIGTIFTEMKDWNHTLLSRYLVGVEPFDDQDCKDCFYLPICEECPVMWYRRKYEGQEVVPCANYKDRLPEFLEMFYDSAAKK
jgi:uncharacterized protein